MWHVAEPGHGWRCEPPQVPVSSCARAHDRAFTDGIGRTRSVVRRSLAHDAGRCFDAIHDLVPPIGTRSWMASKARRGRRQARARGRMTERSPSASRGHAPSSAALQLMTRDVVSTPSMTWFRRGAFMRMGRRRSRWRTQLNVTESAFEKFDVTVGFASRYQYCQFHVSPAIAGTLPVGCGIAVRSSTSDTVPAGPDISTLLE
jgi:hypothetical protein